MIDSELLAIARRLSEACASEAAARAVALTGSVALGIADGASDVDLIVFHSDALPPLAALDAVRATVGGSLRLYVSASADGARFKEGYFVEGVRCDLSHVTVAAFEADMALVLDAHSTDAHAQSRLAGILDSLPLHGAETVGGLKDRASQYPDELARAVVEKHLRFPPFWTLTEMGAGRSELLHLYTAMVEAETNILGTLCGLNRVYLPGEFKHLERLTAILPRAPPDLAPRLRAVLRQEPKAAAEELGALIRETFALVTQHMPEADTDGPRRWFDLPERKTPNSPDKGEKR